MEIAQERRLKIGELARLVGLSIKTIRYYERRGLLEQPQRTEAGYRHYGPEEVARLRFVVAAVFHASTSQFSDTFWVPPLLSGANPFAPSLVSAVLIMALVIAVYGLFKRPVRVEDPERFVHPELDGTWRDWVR